jgi:hypothetical protein
VTDEWVPFFPIFFEEMCVPFWLLVHKVSEMTEMLVPFFWTRTNTRHRGRVVGSKREYRMQNGRENKGRAGGRGGDRIQRVV